MNYTRREINERLVIYHLIAALGVLVPALESLSRGERVFWPLVAALTVAAMANTHRAFIDKTPASPSESGEAPTVNVVASEPLPTQEVASDSASPSEVRRDPLSKTVNK